MNFQKVLRPIFIWRGTCREFIARLAASRPKKLTPLAKKLVKLDFAVVSMVFSDVCHLLASFLDCSRSPCRSLGLVPHIPKVEIVNHYIQQF